MRLYMWEQVTHLFAVIPPTTKPGIKHFRKQLHQMVDVLEFSARDWVEYDTSDYGRASAHLMAEQGKGGRQ